MLRERPLVYVEGTKNIEARRAYDDEIPPVLRALLKQRPGGILLMVTSAYPEIVASTGIPLHQTINESDKQFYQAALAAPATHAAIILAFDGDDIDRAVKTHPAGLRVVRRFSPPASPRPPFMSPMPHLLKSQPTPIGGDSIRLGSRINKDAAPNPQSPARRSLFIPGGSLIPSPKPTPAATIS